MKTILVIAALALCGTWTQAQIRTVTLGITTHCPYGVGGCWAEIRNGLNLTNAIAAIPQKPDTKTQTFDLHMREDWKPDPSLFARNFKVMNVGVNVRGVEAMVDGVVEREGTNLVLRIHGNGVVIRLAPLTHTVQWDTKRNRAEAPTRAERKAYEKLAAQSKKQPFRVRVVGPLVQPTSAATSAATTTATKDAAGRQTLEVRKFELLKDAV